MEGTGFGSFEGKIVVKVAERDIAAAQDKSGTAPERREGDDEHGYFVLPWTVTRHGDVEMVIFEFGHTGIRNQTAGSLDGIGILTSHGRCGPEREGALIQLLTS